MPGFYQQVGFRPFHESLGGDLLMKRKLAGLAAVPVLTVVLLGTAAAPASACDPGMPTCYGPEAWLNARLRAVDELVVQPIEKKLDDAELSCPGPYC
jgi:hypothetical protein